MEDAAEGVGTRDAWSIAPAVMNAGLIRASFLS